MHGILQARILEWIAVPFSRGSSWPRDRTQVSCIAGRFFTIWATGKISGSREIKAFLEEQWKTKLIKIQASLVLVLTKPLRRRKANHFILLCLVLVTQSCPTLHYRMDYSPPGSSVHGILQARILEWIAVSFSRGSSWFRNRSRISCIIGRFFTNWATRETASSHGEKITLSTQFVVLH